MTHTDYSIVNMIVTKSGSKISSMQVCKTFATLLSFLSSPFSFAMIWTNFVEDVLKDFKLTYLKRVIFPVQYDTVYIFMIKSLSKLPQLNLYTISYTWIYSQMLCVCVYVCVWGGLVVLLLVNNFLICKHLLSCY